MRSQHKSFYYCRGCKDEYIAETSIYIVAKTAAISAIILLLLYTSLLKEQVPIHFTLTSLIVGMIIVVPIVHIVCFIVLLFIEGVFHRATHRDRSPIS